MKILTSNPPGQRGPANSFGYDQIRYAETSVGGGTKVGVLVNVPHATAHETSELGLQTLIGLPCSLVVLDSALRVMLVSHALARRFESSSSDLIGRPFMSLVNLRNATGFQRQLEQVLRGHDSFLEGVGPLRAAASPKPLQCHVYPLDGTAYSGPQGLILLITDYSDPLAVQALRQELNEQRAAVQDMGQRLIQSQSLMEERTRQSQEVQQRLRLESERLSVAKIQFLADAVHDMRQPVQALSNIFKPMRHLLDAQGSAQLLSLLATADAATEMLAQQLSGVLDLSRLELGQVQPQLGWLPLAKLMGDLSLQYMSTAQDLGVSCELQPAVIPDVELHTDRTLLMRVLSNLVGNSVKYRDARKAEPSWVRIDMRHDTETQQLILQVVDNGIGIAAEDLANGRIFRPFFQGQRHDRGVSGGVGLGLSIVKASLSLLPKHELGLWSERDVGTTVQVSIPCQPRPLETASRLRSDALHAPNEKDEFPNLSGLQLIFVEDDALVREATKVLFLIMGIDARCAASLQELESLLALWVGRPPDLVMTDHRLSAQATSTEVLHLIRQRWGDIPCLVISGDAHTDIPPPKGVTRYLRIHKPVLPEDLIRCIRQLTV